mmetsp:Transcript_48935/g.126173  ORF Transcript_48935/g.126173 Transcript_48935/m.126173 type:complete len:381 (+) Transcript_48935:512-1654(+)
MAVARLVGVELVRHRLLRRPGNGRGDARGAESALRLHVVLGPPHEAPEGRAEGAPDLVERTSRSSLLAVSIGRLIDDVERGLAIAPVRELGALRAVGGFADLAAQRAVQEAPPDHVVPRRPVRVGVGHRHRGDGGAVQEASPAVADVRDGGRRRHARRHGGAPGLLLLLHQVGARARLGGARLRRRLRLEHLRLLLQVGGADLVGPAHLNLFRGDLELLMEVPGQLQRLLGGGGDQDRQRRLRARPGLRALLQQLQAEVLRRVAHGGEVPVLVVHLLPHRAAERGGHAGALEGRLARQHEVQHHARAEDVHLDVVGRAAEDLWSRVAGRAASGRPLFAVRVAASNAEVREHGLTVVPEEHILHLHVAMYDAAAVDVDEGA